MPRMPRGVRQKVIGGAAVAVLLGGISFAAVSAVGQGDGHPRAWARLAPHRLHPRDIEAAAAYLGMPGEQLAHELSSRSLAQIAEAQGGGKSPQGLIDAIVAARRKRLATSSAALPGRVKAEVSRDARASAFSPLGSAARYLGITPVQLRRKLRAGESLERLARATPGKSKHGLLAALLAPRQRRIAAGLAAGKVTRARATRRERRLKKRMSALVARKFAGAHSP